MEKSEAIDSLQALIPFVLITFIIVIGVILLNHRFRKNLYKQQLEQERERLEHQQDITQTTMQVQEDERERFAKDLHDELGAMLSICIRWLAQLEEGKPENAQKIAEVRELIATVLQSTRRISHDLMPLQLESLGFENALRSLVHRAEKAAQLKVTVNLPKDLDSLDPLMKLSIYRIYSELIGNTLKYARADHIEMEMHRSGNNLHCSYADNGVGLPEDVQREGLGLRSIGMRVKAMHGTWKYGNAEETGGFYAHLVLPLHTR